jgi:2-desacetyl-2-hydroxyethyl bacteriochlorophyllide A dehydrogenase
MKAAFYKKANDIQIENAEIPVPEDNEVLIKVGMAGLCGSDLHRFLGERKVRYTPIILGHEFFGIIDRVGRNVKRFKQGDRVVGNPYFTCGKCEYCISGHRNLCQHRTNIGIDMPGCFAEYIVMPEDSLYCIDTIVPEQEAVMVEPTAVALRAINMAGSLIGKNVVVIGAGTMGQLITQLAVNAGAEVTVTDIVDRKLEVCKKMGASHIINSLENDPIEASRKWTDGQGPGVVIETAGIPITVEQAVKMVQWGGRVIVVGLSTTPAKISPIDIARREIEIIGSVLYVKEFEEAVKLINKRMLNFEPIISHVLPLEKCQEGFGLMAAGKDAMKILLAIG